MADRYHSVFDIIGPVMVGPSSSHTAGAAKIGKVVRRILGVQPDKADIYLYESFAKTYRGHGTDIALVAGLLGMEPEDDRLPQSLEIAQEKGMAVNFFPSEDPAEHPNTTKLVVSKDGQELSVVGVSIGGGAIQITSINDFSVHLGEGKPTILTIHQDVPGIVAKVTQILSDLSVNIASMTVNRKEKGDKAMMLIEVDERDADKALSKLNAIEQIDQISFFA